MPRSKPTPPTEPKQGSEERIEPVTELEAEKHTNKILRAMLAEAEAERDKCYERIEEQADERDALRAELAAAKEEIARTNARIDADRATIAKQAEILNLIADLSDGCAEDGLRVLCASYLALRAEVDELREYIRRREKSGRWGEERDALRAELAAAREEIERCRLILEAGGRENGLRADLQLAREESARFSHHLREQMEATKAQFSRADRAEARVKELEDRIAGFAVIPGGHFARNRERYSNAREWLEREGCAILAARAKEGEKR